ncbi:sulfite exporter TauE/SafE family protein [Paracoccus methylarcula]|uniref:Probable membrane transporter protein n=1 Tax=Paracoccus methylarcula TaxID=72022 RepID=A0A3R7LR55_9RHOB|nr:sulfite exporter TauE/SafE family protein [Paracoccus methylarcula]RNF35911.1 sulfite exporter TauE/SafE family protein [Paracoccus methylarcula]
MTFSLFLLLSSVVFVAAFIQGAIGIGFALIVAPVFGILQPEFLPVTLLILMLPLNFHVAWRERVAIDRPGTGWITLGRFFGTFAGLWMLAALSTQQLGLAVGWFTIIAAAAALAAPPFDPNRHAALGVGLFTGVTETATGIGGPPLALLYQHAPGPVLRSTVATCFFVGEVFSLVILAAMGMFQAGQATAALMLMPAVLIGSGLSRMTHAHISGRALRFGVLIFAILSGAFLILKS